MKHQSTPVVTACGRFGTSTRCGFTFLEMLVVILIIGILASTAVPKFADATRDQRVRAAAFRIAAELNLARRNAKTKGISREVEFDTANDRYDLLGMTHPDNPNADYRVQLNEGAYPVDLIAVDFVSTNDPDSGGGESSGSGALDATLKIMFDMYGRPTTVNSPLVSGSITVRSNSSSATVNVDPITGRATVQ